ncbi:MAG: 3-deoxy-D-manno-octulosonic acid transferase [Candidatus Aureabacteria bacterium]|nr:3-deoxy-D-manno-octulosonic acid transferase [Candidatus Auribacterota bacterium]
MFLFYNLVQFLAFILGLPFWLYLIIRKRKYRYKLGERLGVTNYCNLKKISSENKNNIIIHGVSVGEINAAHSIIEKLRNKENVNTIVTSTTHTGYNNALKIFKKEPVIYFPLDFLFSVKKFLNRTNPKAIILLETEIWPNLFFEARKRKIPIIIINARLSVKSWKGYKLFRFFFKNILLSVKHFAVQTQQDKERFLTLGVPENNISISGNLKFNSAIQKIDVAKKKTIYALLKMSNKTRTIIGGSTHDGEDLTLIETWERLNALIPNLKLILAPRHIDRINDIAKLLKRKSLNYTLFSQINSNSKISNIILVDTIGDLFYLYSIADVVFIGKSLFPPGGGQNMIEAAAWEKPVIFGPYVTHFQTVADSMLKDSAAILINNENELFEALEKLLSSEKEIAKYSNNARNFIKNNISALEISLKIIFKYVEIK